MDFIFSLPQWKKYVLFLITAILVLLFVNLSFLTVDVNAPLYLMIIGCLIVFLILLFRKPQVGLIALIPLCFLYVTLTRELAEIPFIVLIDVLVVTTCIACFFSANTDKTLVARNDLSLLLLIWVLISLLQAINPEGASIEGWAAEIRYLAIHPLLITVISFMVLRNIQDLNKVIILFIGLALLACLAGFKQHFIGLSAADQLFMDSGGDSTHILWGKLRVFSFYDASRFGCLMAQFAIVSTVLAFGDFKLWKRVVFIILAGLFAYGMLLSGTRTALMVIVAGAFYAIIVSKNFKILILGGIFMLLFLSFLKFTHIGSGNYEIYRLRSALDPSDPSLNVRFTSQQALKQYMRTRPLGAGIGVIGYYGHKFNSDKFPSTIEPDSQWVKIWVMYGVVGMIIWFGIYMYIFGKCFGIIWNIKDRGLRFKLIALTSSSFGIFCCSYGNEIINMFPSLLVVAVSLVLVYQGPRMDREISSRLQKDN